MTVLIGTFKKGLTGKASFDFAVVESQEQLRAVKKLSELPRLLSAARQPAGKQPAELPEISADPKQIKSLPQTVNANPSGISIDKDALTAELDSVQPSSREEDVPPPPPTQLQNSERPQGPQRLGDAILDGIAIYRGRPVYPPTARMMGAFGMVRVQVTISESGRVIEARAISGHQSLRSAAIEAALKWVFKPTTLDGVPIKVQGVLNFSFNNKKWD